MAVAYPDIAFSAVGGDVVEGGQIAVGFLLDNSSSAVYGWSYGVCFDPDLLSVVQMGSWTDTLVSKDGGPPDFDLSQPCPPGGINRGLIIDTFLGVALPVRNDFRDFRVTPSQGTHFYQSIASLNVGYFTVNANVGEGFVDWDWLESLPAIESEGAVRLIRLEKPAVAILNGRERKGVILRPESTG